MTIHPADHRSSIRRLAILAAGDTIAFLLFATLGRRSHGATVDLAALPETVRTAAPFLLGWLTAGWLAGAFDRRQTADPGTMLLRTLIGWTGGILLGAVFRAIMVGRFSPPSFYIVTFLVTLLLLGGWRVVFALLEGRRFA